jgi:hypothetical protein
VGGQQKAAAESFDKLVSSKYNGQAEPAKEHYWEKHFMVMLVLQN